MKDDVEVQETCPGIILMGLVNFPFHYREDKNDASLIKVRIREIRYLLKKNTSIPI